MPNQDSLEMPGRTVFELPQDLCIYTVQSVHANLTEWTQSRPASNILLISAGQVEKVDGAGLQLLAALSNGEQAWRLVEASAVFAEACRTLGLAQWLDSRHTKIEGAST